MWAGLPGLKGRGEIHYRTGSTRTLPFLPHFLSVLLRPAGEGREDEESEVGKEVSERRSEDMESDVGKEESEEARRKEE